MTRHLTPLAAIYVIALVAVPAAAPHGPAGGGVGYVSTVDSLRPPVLGVTARVLGGDDRLQLVNYSGKTIVVKGYDGEPFLRFTKSGVYENANSPTTYLSRARDQAGIAVPAFASPGAVPAWRKASGGSTFAWHDRRIRWTQPDLPPVVKAAPMETHLVFRWRVPAEADAKRFAIFGFLGYAPTPETLAAGSGGTRPWLVVAVVGVSLLAAVGLAVGARRATRRAPAP